jgi:hypothetical protein
MLAYFELHCLAAAGKAQTFNDLFELDTSTPEEYKWKQLTTSGSVPPPRARHCAVAVGASMHHTKHACTPGV